MFLSILRRIVPIPNLCGFRRVLFIGPHPDDIETGCAPTVRAMTAGGVEVAFLIATDGRMGSADPARTGDSLVRIRQEEARASASLLGVSDITFLPFPDSGSFSEETLAHGIAKVIAEKRPDAVFAPDPDVISECHADHLKTGRAAKAAMIMAPYASIMESIGGSGSHAVQALALYYTDRPNAYVPVSRTFDFRRQALLLHKSQFSEAMIQDIVRYYTLRSIRLGLRRLKGRCDGYRALAPTHMHCFPEAAEFRR